MHREFQDTLSTTTVPTVTALHPPIPWYYRRPMTYLTAIFFYPVGIVLTLKSPLLRRWEKIVGALLVPCAIVTLVLCKPYWDFDGDMSLLGFRLDFGKGTSQYTKLEKHRQHQKEETAAKSAAQPAGDLALSWPAFRGAARDGVVHGETISLDWEKSPPKQVWRQPIGEGYAAFVLGKGRLYTVEQRRDREVIACYDFANGREIWTHEYRALFSETLGGDGPRATPTLEGDLLYALGAEGHLLCLNVETRCVQWKRHILEDFHAKNLSWAMSSSPLIVDGKVIVTNSGIGGGSVIAYDAQSGKVAWNNDLGQQGYSSPVLVTLLGQRQILNLSAFNLNALDPQSGKLIWQFPWRTEYGNNCSQPILAGGDRIFLSSSYGKGCSLIQLEKKDGKISAQELWSNINMRNKFTSSVIHNGFAYGLDEKILVCLDLATGERRWKSGRFGHGSLLLVNDYLLIMSEQGQLTLAKADPEKYKEMGSVQIFDDRTWNNFLLAGGRLVARNHKEMVCYDLRPSKTP